MLFVTIHRYFGEEGAAGPLENFLRLEAMADRSVSLLQMPHG